MADEQENQPPEAPTPEQPKAAVPKPPPPPPGAKPAAPAAPPKPKGPVAEPWTSPLVDAIKLSSGVGGTRRGVKCLHAHYAWFLAGGDDPVGRWVAGRLT